HTFRLLDGLRLRPAGLAVAGSTRCRYGSIRGGFPLRWLQAAARTSFILDQSFVCISIDNLPQRQPSYCNGLRLLLPGAFADHWPSAAWPDTVGYSWKGETVNDQGSLDPGYSSRRGGGTYSSNGGAWKLGLQ